MSNLDWLPETADELVTRPTDRCICRFADVPDPDDVEEECSPRPFGKWYPRTTWKLVEYNPKCRYGDHAKRAVSA